MEDVEQTLPFELIGESICVDANQSATQDRDFADTYDPSKHVCRPRGGGELMCSDSRCYNRNHCVECIDCHSTCANQMFQKRQFANIDVRDCAGKGQGLFTLDDLKAGDIVAEYVGEVISAEELHKRQSEIKNSRHMYILELVEKKVYLDSTSKGNITRFINHSCQPNCIMEVWYVDSVLRVAIRTIKDVTITDDSEGAVEELTFDYEWDPLPGRKPTKCLCGTSSCRGTIELLKGKSNLRKYSAGDDISMDDIFPDDEFTLERESELANFKMQFNDLRKGVGKWKTCFEPFSLDSIGKVEQNMNTDTNDGSSNQLYPNLLEYLRNIDCNWLVNKFIKCWWEGNQEYFEALVLRVEDYSSTEQQQASMVTGDETSTSSNAINQSSASAKAKCTRYVIRYEIDGSEFTEDLLDMNALSVSKRHKWYWFDFSDHIKSLERRQNDSSETDDDFVVDPVSLNSTHKPGNIGSNRIGSGGIGTLRNTNSSIKKNKKSIDVEIDIDLVHYYCPSKSKGNSNSTSVLSISSEAFEFKSHLLKSAPDAQVFFESNQTRGQFYHYTISGEEVSVNKCLLVIKNMRESYKDVLRSNVENYHRGLIEHTPAISAVGDWRMLPVKFLGLAFAGAKKNLADNKVGGGNLASWLSLEYFVAKLTNKAFSSSLLTSSSYNGITAAQVSNNNSFMEYWLEEVLSNCDCYAISGLMKPSTTFSLWQSFYERGLPTSNSKTVPLASSSVSFLRSSEESSKMDLFRAKFLHFLQKVAEKLKLPASSALYATFLAIRYTSTVSAKKLLSEDVSTNITGLVSIALKGTQKFKPGKLVIHLIVSVENIVHGKEIAEDSSAFQYCYNCMLSKEIDILETLKYDLQLLNSICLGSFFCDICNSKSTDRPSFTNLSYSSVGKILQSVYHDYHMHKVIISSCNNKNFDAFEILTSLSVAFPDVVLLFPSELLLLSSSVVTLLIQYFYYYHKLIPASSSSSSKSSSKPSKVPTVSYKTLSNHASMLKNDKYNESSNNNYFSLFLYILETSRSQYGIKSAMLISFVCNLLVLVFANEGYFSIVSEISWIRTNGIFDDWEDRHEISAFLHGVLYIWAKRHKEMKESTVIDSKATIASGGSNFSNNNSTSRSGINTSGMDVDTASAINTANSSNATREDHASHSLPSFQPQLKCRLPFVESMLSLDSDNRDIESVVRFDSNDVLLAISEDTGLIAIKKNALSSNLRIRCDDSDLVNPSKITHGLFGDSVVFAVKPILSAKQRQFEEKKVRHSLAACGIDSVATSMYHNVGFSWSAVQEMNILSSLHSGYSNGLCPYFTQIVAMGRFGSPGDNVSAAGGGGSRSSLGNVRGSSNGVFTTSSAVAPGKSSYLSLISKDVSIKSLSKYLDTSDSDSGDRKEYYSELLPDLIMLSKNSSVQQKNSPFHSSLNGAPRSSHLPTHYITTPLLLTLSSIMNVMTSSHYTSKPASSPSISKTLLLAWVRDLFTAAHHLNSKGYFMKWISPDNVYASSAGVLVISDLSGVVKSNESANQLLQLIIDSSADSSGGKADSRPWLPSIPTTSPEVLVGGIPTFASSLYSVASLSVAILSGRYLTKEVSAEKDKDADSKDSGVNPTVSAHLLKLFEMIGTPRGVRLENPALSYYSSCAYNTKVKLKDGTETDARCRLSKNLPNIIPFSMYDGCQEESFGSLSPSSSSPNGTYNANASVNSSNPILSLLSNCLSLNPQLRIVENGVGYFDRFKCFACGDLLNEDAKNERVSNMSVLSEIVRKYDKVKYFGRMEKISKRGSKIGESMIVASQANDIFSLDDDLDVGFGGGSSSSNNSSSSSSNSSSMVFDSERTGLAYDEVAEHVYLYTRALDKLLVSANSTKPEALTSTMTSVESSDAMVASSDLASSRTRVEYVDNSSSSHSSNTIRSRSREKDGGGRDSRDRGGRVSSSRRGRSRDRSRSADRDRKRHHDRSDRDSYNRDRYDSYDRDRYDKDSSSDSRGSRNDNYHRRRSFDDPSSNSDSNGRDHRSRHAQDYGRDESSKRSRSDFSRQSRY